MEQQQIKNKWALILGGSSGLGWASAVQLAKDGFHMCIVHRTRRSALQEFEKRANSLKEHGIEVKLFNSNALQKETLNTVLTDIPKHSLRVLIHSIAKGSLKTMRPSDTSSLHLEDINITLHAMATSWYQWTQAAITKEVFAATACNMAFTSEGNTKVWPGYGAVSAAKATLEALMRQMAVEFAPLGMRTNCIQAGTTETPSFHMIPGSEQLAQMAQKRNPFNRLTTPEDIGNVVSLLCSDKAEWINGTVVVADGGEHLR